MFVIIAGGGKIGRDVAKSLIDENHSVLVIEKEEKSCTLIDTEIPSAKFICDDACEPTILERAETRQADVVAALTGDDEDNLVIAFLAKTQFGVPRIIARVNNPRNEWLFTKRWGVDVAVSSARLISQIIHEEVSLEGLVTLLKLRRGDVSLIETELAPESASVDKKIMDLSLPEDCVIAAIIRDDHVIFPKGETVLLTGDQVLALVTAAHDEALMKALK